jgi:D-amino-acid dehydrogenase
MKAGDMRSVENIADALRALHAPTIERYRTLVAWAGCAELLVERGQLFLYESEAEFAGDAFGLALRRDRGVAMEVLGGDELRQLEPAVAPFFEKAVYLPEQAQCLNPHRLVQALAAKFVAEGGRIERRRIGALKARDGRITHLTSETGDIAVDTVVLAAGAWSGGLLKTAGIHVPLEAERGYHVTVSDPATMPRIQATWSRRKFVATPQETGLRFAGTDEFAGLTAPPDERRAQVLLRHGKQMIPGLGDTVHTTWMGHRPGTPDSLPVIGRDPRKPKKVNTRNI